ncbi:MAG: DUF2563 family protein [Mycolicibacterium cosmeticum]|nr:DUF2563 family protein [Mycolicibacterium cosmeticum]
MEVDTDHLHAGAARCIDAAATALAAASRLAEKKPPAGMFGDFEAAQSYHRAVAQAHEAHVDQLNAHHRDLTGVGEKSHSGADQFTAADVSSADALNAAEAGLEAR